MDTLLRQWAMLKKIPRYPAKKSVAELYDMLQAEGFQTTRRTIERDLNKLSETFQISCDEHKPAGWYYAPDAYQFDIPGMSSHSALVFRMVERHLYHLLPRPCLDLLNPYFGQAEKVLAEIRPQPLADWPDKVAVLTRGLSLCPPYLEPDVLFNVYQGVLTARQLKVLYRRRGDDHAEERIVNPLGLVAVDQVHYLVCTFWNYTDVRQLAMHRIESADPLDEPVAIPDGFDLQTYAASGAFGYPEGDGTLKLKVLFDNFTAQQFKETPLSDDQKLTERKDGRVLLEAEVRDTAQLRWWLQGFGAAVEVLGPKKLRDEFAEISRQLASLYT